MGVSRLARELALSKAVVHRILQSLTSRDLIAFDPATRKYSLGPSAVALGARALRQLDLRSVARARLVHIRESTGETSTLSLLVSDKRTYIDQFESEQEIKMTVELGRLHPLYAGASSRAILAHLPDDIVERVISEGLQPLTDATIKDEKKLRNLLQEVRESGYAVSSGERQSGAGSVAAPIFAGDGRVIGSLSTCGPLARFDREAIKRYVPIVTEAASQVSADLGDQAH